MKFRLSPVTPGFIAVASCALAQPAPEEFKAGTTAPKDSVTFHFRANVGSFKLLNGAGKVEFTFRGTTLIHPDKNAQVTVTGNVKKQYEGRDRIVYFGIGKVTIIGKWRAVQVFGKDMDGLWFGTGKIRLAGAFDKNLETGKFWWDDPNEVSYWPGTATIDVDIVGYKKKPDPVPTERKG